MENHIADAEIEFTIVNVTPDFCKVGNQIVPFDISRVLQPEQGGFAQSVFARSEKVLLVDSLIDGTQGNAGSGMNSNVSQQSGHHKILAGASTVFIEGRMAARHGDLVDMNGKVS